MVPRRVKNYVLLLAGTVFYFYGEQRLVLLMLFTALWDYGCAMFITLTRAKGKKVWPRVGLIASIVMDVGILCYFKYTDFFISNINAIAGTKIPLLGIALPIGISFYTFQSMSYVIDVYRDKVRAVKNPFTYATYLTLYPQLIAGPIVRFETVASELEYRTHSFDKISSGAMRFTIGMAKKILIANILGEFCASFASITDKTVVLCWLYAIAYSLQIYFDFSGYSDMAIGIGRIFGFSFCENFDYPYISRSVTEFWRRWHMSLGQWFRDYIYIPLGGSRRGTARWLLSVFTVWFVTGMWHGAGWNFIIWGLFFGVLLVLEKLFLRKLFDKIPTVFSHIYTLLAVAVSFVIFSCTEYLGGFSAGLSHIASMFGFGGLPFMASSTLYYLRDYAFVIALGVVGSTPLVRNTCRKLCDKFTVANLATPVAMAAMIMLCVCELSDATFNPFLYFNF